MRIQMRRSAHLAMPRLDEFIEVVQSRNGHRGNRKQKRKLQRRCSRKPAHLPSRNGRHRPRRSRQERRNRLAQSNPHRPADPHIFNLRSGLAFARPAQMRSILRIDNPHHDATHEQAASHQHQVLEVLAHHFRQKIQRRRRTHKRNRGQPDGMRQCIAVAPRPLWKSREEP